MIEDTPGYHEMMRMTHNDFLKILQLIEADITPRSVDRSKDPFLRHSISLPFLCFRFQLRAFLR